MMVLYFPMSAPAHSGEAKVDSREPPPALVVRGDAEASRALWDHYAPPVRRFVQRMMGPGFDPSDLVQEVFSNHSYGFRPGRRAHDAVCSAHSGTSRKAVTGSSMLTWSSFSTGSITTC